MYNLIKQTKVIKSHINQLVNRFDNNRFEFSYVSFFDGDYNKILNIVATDYKEHSVRVKFRIPNKIVKTGLIKLVVFYHNHPYFSNIIVSKKDIYSKEYIKKEIERSCQYCKVETPETKFFLSNRGRYLQY